MIRDASPLSHPWVRAIKQWFESSRSRRRLLEYFLSSAPDILVRSFCALSGDRPIIEQHAESLKLEKNDRSWIHCGGVRSRLSSTVLHLDQLFHRFLLYPDVLPLLRILPSPSRIIDVDGILLQAYDRHSVVESSMGHYNRAWEMGSYQESSHDRIQEYIVLLGIHHPPYGNVSDVRVS